MALSFGTHVSRPVGDCHASDGHCFPSVWTSKTARPLRRVRGGVSRGVYLMAADGQHRGQGHTKSGRISLSAGSLFLLVARVSVPAVSAFASVDAFASVARVSVLFYWYRSPLRTPTSRKAGWYARVERFTSHTAAALEASDFQNGSSPRFGPNRTNSWLGFTGGVGGEVRPRHYFFWHRSLACLTRRRGAWGTNPSCASYAQSVSFDAVRDRDGTGRAVSAKCREMPPTCANLQ
jgi:hypothetical protein